MHLCRPDATMLSPPGPGGQQHDLMIRQQSAKVEEKVMRLPIREILKPIQLV